MSSFKSSGVKSGMIDLHLTVRILIFGFLLVIFPHLFAMISLYGVLYDDLLFRTMGGGSLGGGGGSTSLGTKKLSCTDMTTLVGCSTFISRFKSLFKREFSFLTGGISMLTSGVYGISKISIINDSASLKRVLFTKSSRTPGSTPG